MTGFRRLLGYFAPYRTKFIIAVLSMLAVNLFRAAGPMVLQQAVDSLTEQTPNWRLLQYGGLLILIGLIQGTFRFLQRRLFVDVSHDIEYDLRNDFYHHLQKLPAQFFQANRTGDLMARATNDLEAVRTVVGWVLMFLANLLFSTLLILPVMVTLSWRLTLLSLLSVPFAAAATKVFSKRIHDKSKSVQESFGMVANRAQESFSGVRTVRAYTQERAEIESFRRVNRQYINERLGLIRLSALFDPVHQFFIGLGSIAALWYGGSLIMQGKLSIGQFVEFTIYVQYLVYPMSILGMVISLFQRGMASMGRINAVMSTEPAISDFPNQVSSAQIAGEIEFRGLSFTYERATRPALDGINLRIAPGQTVGLVGAVGSGKSTLMNLIPRLLDAEPGQVLIDGYPIRSIPLRELRSAIGYAPQEAFLFSETFAANIAFGMEQASLAEIELAAREAGIADDIAEFPDGYGTIVGERGLMLSGGQRQRTTIARAVIRRPRILILDDALSSVDTYTEERILKHLERVMRERTCLISSHRTSTVRKADLIVVLHEGRIAEKGTHDELLSRPGIYAKLYEKQLLEEELAATT